MSNITIDVIIPSRQKPMKECIAGVLFNTPPISSYKVVVDDGRGQTLIRYEGALESKADFVLLLDDDASMRPGVVQKYLDKILEGYDAVCGHTNPLPLNNFSKRITKFMTNPSTFFYPVGCTLWRREKFIKIMNEIGQIHKYLGDNRLNEQIVKGNYKVVRCEDAITDHLWKTTPSKFFKKRLGYGYALAEMYYIDGTFFRNWLKFLVSIPLSTGYGIFLYRLATFIGMTKYLVKKI